MKKVSFCYNHKRILYLINIYAIKSVCKEGGGAEIAPPPPILDKRGEKKKKRG